ncbi:bactericidal permeability-increasing protein-like [Arapaima gigas]
MLSSISFLKDSNTGITGCFRRLVWLLKMCCFLVVLLTLIPQVLTVNPGLKVVLTDKGLQYASHVGMVFLQEKISTVPIPDVDGDIDIGLLGSIHYVLSGMRVEQVNVPEPTVTFSEGIGIKAGIDGLNMVLHGKWQTHYLFINDGGTFDLAVLNMGTSILLQLGSDDHGRLNVSNCQCDSSIGNTQIKFHGGARYNLQSQHLCYFIQFLHANVFGYHCYPFLLVSFQVNQNLLLEVPLLVSPIIQSSDMELDLKGEFYSVKHQTEPPFSAGSFELPQPAGLMLVFGLTEFSVNSALYAYFSAGLLQVNITDDMIPKYSPIHLNTTSLGTFIPQLPKMYPNLLVLLQVYTRDTPMISFQADNVTFNISGSSKAYCIQPNSTLTPLFRLDMSANFNAKVFISQEKLKGSVDLNNFTLTLGSSEIGTFQTDPLKNSLLAGIKMFLLANINASLKAGINLPAIKNIQLVNSVLKVNKGFVAMATDATVSPPEPKS